jgi:isoquinoline 1-oxidoreductase beta subunit
MSKTPSRAGKIARRGFLIGALALGGGVAFGVYAVRRDPANPLAADLPEDAATLTPYVLIDADGVTLITPRADLGQGAYHVQAMLLAEELDVRLDQVRLDPGPPSPAYWNGALATEAAEFFVPRDGRLQDMAEGGVRSALKLMGLQITGGSTTVPDAWVKLRAAGASARETLKLAAAKRTGAALSDLRSEDGAVILPDGARLPYTDLVADLAGLDPVQDVALRDPAQWRYIGKSMQRTDIVDKSTGAPIFGIDAEVLGMVHAAVQLNPAMGAAMESFDDSVAREMRGVRMVVPVTGGIAAVADNTWRAMQAASAVEVTWASPAHPAEMADHWAALDRAFDAGSPDSRKRDDGDIEAALASAGEVIEAEYRAPYVAHAPLEPVNAIVRVDEDRAEVWTGTQIPRFVQQNVAGLTGLAAEAVTVHVLPMGGSFGHRLEDEVVKRATEVAMAMTGTPVKLTYSREEDMAQDFPRQIAKARLRGAVADGRVEALSLDIAMPSVMASQMARQGQPAPGPDSQIVAGAWNAPFAIPHHRVTGWRAEGLAPVSSWRSVGASTNGAMYNMALDELIHAAGADPLEERLRLASGPRARAALEAVGEMCNWSGPTGGATANSIALGEIGARGRGVALVQSFGVPCAQVVEVVQAEDGIRIETVWVAAEVGRVIDPVNFENQVQGGVIWGLGHAISGEATFRDGAVTQRNFDTLRPMRIWQAPQIRVRALELDEAVHGIGEPPVPPAPAALAGAIFAATGTRLREMPFDKTIRFA